jgi:hypothetical protein
MTQRENKRTNPLNQNVGDYVYMLTEPTDKGRKLQSTYSGPYVYIKRKCYRLQYFVPPFIFLEIRG